MSRARVLLSPQALEDLDGIWSFLAEESFQLADRIDAEIRGAILRLADFPGLGHPREDLTDLPVRFWTIYSYLIVYLAREGVVEIVRVIHASRDLPGLIEPLP
jgi:plasmid stabilization system protein ParE